MPTPWATNEGFPLFFSGLPSNEGETGSYLRKSTISHYNWFLSSTLCERKAWDEILCLFRYDFCFLTILTDVFVWCSGWDPIAFTWQPGNQSFTVAMVTRGGQGGEVHLITVRCVPSWNTTEFLDRGHYEHNNNKKILFGIKTAVSWHHKTSCTGGCGWAWGRHHKEAKDVAFSPQSSGCWPGRLVNL